MSPEAPVKNAVEVSGAPRPVGPYSQAQVVSLPGGGVMAFTAGQVPLDPATGEMKSGSITEQTEQVMKNLGAVLESAGLGFGDVVRCTIYLTDLADFTLVNAVYGRSFARNPPARATVQVAGLPKGARVEIDAIAVAV